MIPIIRSFAELMAITQSRDSHEEKYIINRNDKIIEKNDIARNNKPMLINDVKLPKLPAKLNSKWFRSKKAVKQFLNDLDYNNQIQSSLDLTLLGRQYQKDHHDAA